MVRRGPVVRVVIAITIALLFFSSIVSAVSFLAGPSVVPGNATTQSALSCQFTPNGTGTLIANITWWYYNTSWNNHVDDNQSIGVTSGVSMTSNSVSAPYTAKGQ
ncbi:hypothetical protein K9M74_04965, partial [Candidatus Woesearchaeota archaeon]|nr:hypothetical protein [Candidatus Woesearchaeota archaeon]